MSLSKPLAKELSSRVLHAPDFCKAQAKLFSDQAGWSEFSPVLATVMKRVLDQILDSRRKRLMELKSLPHAVSLQLNELVEVHYEVVELEAFIAAEEEWAAFRMAA